MAGEFYGKRVLVTGGTKGMGEAIVRRLREAGAMVFTTARSAPATLARRTSSSPPISARRKAVAVRALERMGGIDILVNNVGGSSARG